MCNGSSSFLSARGLFWSNFPCFLDIKVFTKPTLRTNKAHNENKLKTKTKHQRDYLSFANMSSSYNQGEDYSVIIPNGKQAILDLLEKPKLSDFTQNAARLGKKLYKQLTDREKHPIFVKLDSLSNVDVKNLHSQLNLKKVASRSIEKMILAIAGHFFENHPIAWNT